MTPESIVALNTGCLCMIVAISVGTLAYALDRVARAIRDLDRHIIKELRKSGIFGDEDED